MDQPRPVVRILAGTTTLLSRMSVGRGEALAIIEIGAIAFFAAGIAYQTLGQAAPIFLLAAVIVGQGLRAVDLETCALFIPGGAYGLVQQALGRPASKVVAAGLIVQHLLFGALAAMAAGQYVVALGGLVPIGRVLPGAVPAEDLATAIAVALLGFVWWRGRQGRAISTRLTTRTTSAGLALVALTIVGSLASLVGGRRLDVLFEPARALADFPTGTVLSALGLCLFAAGGIDTLGRVAPEFPQPRIRHLQHTAKLVTLHSLWFTALTGLLFAAVVPLAIGLDWTDTPIVALAATITAPGWVRGLVWMALTAAALPFLTLSAERSLAGLQTILSRLSEDGVLASSLRTVHPRFGTPSRLLTLSFIAELAIIFASGGQTTWMARVYAIGVATAALLAIAALVHVRARTARAEPRAFRTPLNLRIGRHEWPIGLGLVAFFVGTPAVFLIAGGDGPAVAGALFLGGLVAVLVATERQARSHAPVGIKPEELVATPFVGLDEMEVRPGSLLVAVRRPHVLDHLVNALRAAGDRDIVVMTVRVIGTDVSDDLAAESRTTPEERTLLAAVLRVAERHGRAVRLLIVPATNVFDAITQTVLRLQCSEIYTGESETLSAADQARLLGEAWERAPKDIEPEVRLVIHHRSGRTVVYHLGAHAPALSTDDLHLIHALWLDNIKAVGPHVHHRDIVRAALTIMEEQLNTEGAARQAALDLVRRVARPADELAAAVHQRDFVRLRDMVRNRPAGDLAALLPDLTLEDQVLMFRTLPRPTAAATFEYLSYESQQSLIKAMAQEDVASLLNNMSPDDRTTFLEELPASVTQQLLTLLTPEERTVAVTLLGYPEGSIGRLMTPDYIAVREHWTVQQVLDYVRQHGQDSETLNVIYVVDEAGVLIDDIRIREILLADPLRTVADLSDHHFVALKASDSEQAAVAVFRAEDRVALPVTDSAGVLIGIVTIDDVLDVAEAAATQDIQRIGGSEALDEPYMKIAFYRMIQKRAGWLTALFLGEMLTATAMGAFEREIERAVVLALFVPLIISSGGNSGSQASTLVIRAIALGEVTLGDWWRVMRRELLAGLTLGGILGSIGFLRITVWSAFSTIYGPHWLLVAVTVAIALVGVVIWGTLVGSVLPFLLRRLGFDPAASSAPFVATLVDVTGLVIYFTVAIVVLRGTLL